MNLQAQRATIVIAVLITGASGLGAGAPVLALQDPPVDATPAAAETRISVAGGENPRTNGRRLLRALEGLEAPLETPVLVKLGRGTFDLQGKSMLLESRIRLEGQNEELTRIVAAGGPFGPNDVRATVEIAGPASLAKLTVESAGGGQESAVAVLIRSGKAELVNVTATASGGKRLNYGIRIVRGDVELRQVTASASGGSVAYGISVKDFGRAAFLNVKAEASGADRNYGVFVLNEHDVPELSLELRGVEGKGRQGKTSRGLHIIGQGKVEVAARSTFEASGATDLNSGLSAYGQPPLFLDISNSTLRAEGGKSFGLELTGNAVRESGGRVVGGLKICNSTVSGGSGRVNQDAGVPGLAAAARPGEAPCDRSE